MNRSSSQLWAAGALMVLALIWSYNWVLMKIAIRYASPFDFAAMRAFYGALSLFLVLFIQGRSLRLPMVPGLVWYGILQSGATVGLSTWALVSGGAGKTAILTYTMSFWTVLFAWVFLGETLRLRQWISLGFAAVGLGFILMPLTLTDELLSKGLAILAGVTWAMASTVLRQLRLKEPLDPIVFTAWQMLFGSVPLILVSLWLPSSPVQWSVEFLWILGYNAIPASAIAWLLWFYALKHLSTDTASLGALLTPVLSIPIAALHLGEIPSPTELLGIGLILLALVLKTPIEGVFYRFKPQKTNRMR
ncbi:MAG: EamA family transporter [Cyanobacteria bacterium P01_D01_bin.56]